MNHNIFQAWRGNLKTTLLCQRLILSLHNSFKTQLMNMKPYDFFFCLRSKLLLFTAYADVAFAEGILITACKNFSLLDIGDVVGALLQVTGNMS